MNQRYGVIRGSKQFSEVEVFRCNHRLLFFIRCSLTPRVRGSGMRCNISPVVISRFLTVSCLVEVWVAIFGAQRMPD